VPTINELFSLEYGHSLELNRQEQSSAPDAVNFVGRAARNNGVTAKVRLIPELTPAPAGTVTVALGGQGGAGIAFLQPFPYYCGRDVMILKPRTKMTEQEILWWVTCISANRFRFGFGRQANRTLKDLVLLDPVAIPPWVKAANTDCYKGANAPARTKTEVLSKTDSWKSFALQDIFDIRKGQRLTKADMLQGRLPYIGASDSSNGITSQIGQEAIHEGGTISVSYDGSIAEAFYQPAPYWASDAVNVLYPKSFKFTPAIALFFCTIIRKEKYRFTYGRKWHLERMRESIIKLPVTPKGEPDWSYMERYIKTLPYSSQIGQKAI
jgi:hypothetical protein